MDEMARYSCSDALDLVLHLNNNGCSPSSADAAAAAALAFSVSVRALCDLHDGDVVATISKQSCLTMQNSRARRLIVDAGLDGLLGLAVAIMYERRLGPHSAWFDYLQFMPLGEHILLLWSDCEIDTLLAGTELHQGFNTYGSLGNAALLHRYGFAEADNPYDILNIDLEQVLKWSFSLYSPLHSRRRLSFWRRLDYSGCVNQNSEYFETSFEEEPQVELLVLLYIMLLSEEGYNELDLLVSSTGDPHGSANHSTLGKVNVAFWKNLELNRDFLQTKGVGDGLLPLADIRESLYGPKTLENDIKALNKCYKRKEDNLYHSLVLRISKRRILERFRSYAACGTKLPMT